MKGPGLFKKIAEKLKEKFSSSKVSSRLASSTSTGSSQKFTQRIAQNFKTRIAKLSQKQFLFLSFIVSCLIFLLILAALPDSEKQQQTNVAKQEQQKKVQEVEKIKVIKAKYDLPQLTVIREDMVELVEMPKNLVPEEPVTDKAMIANMPTVVTILKGDVITKKKVYTNPQMAGFPGKIPDNCRAIAIPLTDITGVAGFIKPGDFVDVMIIKNQNNVVTGEIVLQNVMLLSVNKDAKVVKPGVKDPGVQMKEEKEKEQGDKPTGDTKGTKQTFDGESQTSAQSMATVTLALTPNDALKLAVASQGGTVYLTLRPIVPSDMFTDNTHYEVINRSGGNAPAANPPAVTQTAPPSGAVTAQVPARPVTPGHTSAVAGGGNAPTIEVIRGTESKMESAR